MVGRAHCTCTCTVFGMDSLSSARIVHRCLCLYVHIVLILVQCLTWIAWATNVVYLSAYACTLFGMDNLNCASSWCTWVLELVRVLVHLLYFCVCTYAYVELGLSVESVPRVGGCLYLACTGVPIVRLYVYLRACRARLCDPGEVACSSRMYGSGVVLGLHLLYGA